MAAKKIKLNLCVYELCNWQQYGIGHYEYNIAKGLGESGKYDICGTTFRNNVEALPFKVVRHFLPYRYLFDNPFIEKACPIPYNWLCGDFNSDVSIFFSNKVPRLKLCGKVIGVLHDLIPLRITNCLLNEGIPVGRIKQFRQDFERLVQKSTKVCTVSEHSKKDICKEFGLSTDKVCVVPPGVDLSYFSNIDTVGDRTVKEKYKLPERYFLYFGGLREYKNVNAVIEAYSRIPGDLRRRMPFVIGGGGLGKERVLEVAQKCGVLADVRLLGFVQEDEKPSIYRMASVFVFVSKYEGFGMPALEAMASGVPVIGSSAASLPEVIGEAGEIVPPDDISGLTQKMIELAEDDELRARLINAGRSRARAFTWQESVRKMSNVIDSI